VLTEALVLRDPDVPVIGNPNGDISIVEWYDYNCPYCRKVAPELRARSSKTTARCVSC
jgi:protein-disulfide isomerase